MFHSLANILSAVGDDKEPGLGREDVLLDADGYDSQDDAEESDDDEEPDFFLEAFEACVFVLQYRHNFSKTSKFVIPAKAGIQHITDLFAFNILDPGFRRGDDAFFFSNLLNAPG